MYNGNGYADNQIYIVRNNYSSNKICLRRILKIDRIERKTHKRIDNILPVIRKLVLILKSTSSYMFRYTFDILRCHHSKWCDLPLGFVWKGYRVEVALWWKLVRFVKCYQKSIIVCWRTIIFRCIGMQYNLESTIRSRCCR